MVDNKEDKLPLQSCCQEAWQETRQHSEAFRTSNITLPSLMVKQLPHWMPTLHKGCWKIKSSEKWWGGVVGGVEELEAWEACFLGPDPLGLERNETRHGWTCKTIGIIWKYNQKSQNRAITRSIHARSEVFFLSNFRCDGKMTRIRISYSCKYNRPFKL